MKSIVICKFITAEKHKTQRSRIFRNHCVGMKINKGKMHSVLKLTYLQTYVYFILYDIDKLSIQIQIITTPFFTRLICIVRFYIALNYISNE